MINLGKRPRNFFQPYPRPQKFNERVKGHQNISLSGAPNY